MTRDMTTGSPLRRILAPGDFWWEFFARVWVRLIPLRPVLTRIYGLIRKIGLHNK